MSQEPIGNTSETFIQRLRQLEPPAYPHDDRGRMRMVVDNLVLHLHPTKVPVRTLQWTYTWGLGGLSGMLIMMLAMTGILLQMNYTPSPPQAYLDILALRSNTWFGDLLRNIHHWSANLLVVVALLHLLRVFSPAAHRPPRQLNWLLGIAMLLLVLGANFTGYLLPWDQLAYWAITVGTSILTYIPLVGESLSRLLLGGPEVGAATLLNFYSLHISFIPLGIVMLMSYHFWRVRKDGGLTIPKKLEEKEEPKQERVTTIPHLVRRELVFAVVWIGSAAGLGDVRPGAIGRDRQSGGQPQPGQSALVFHGHPGAAAALPSIGWGNPDPDAGTGRTGAAAFLRSQASSRLASISARRAAAT